MVLPFGKTTHLLWYQFEKVPYTNAQYTGIYNITDFAQYENVRLPSISLHNFKLYRNYKNAKCSYDLNEEAYVMLHYS